MFSLYDYYGIHVMNEGLMLIGGYNLKFVSLFAMMLAMLRGRTGAIVTGGNCNTLNSSNQNQARVMKLNLQMLSKIISLPVEKDHNHIT